MKVSSLVVAVALVGSGCGASGPLATGVDTVPPVTSARTAPDTTETARPPVTTTSIAAEPPLDGDGTGPDLTVTPGPASIEDTLLSAAAFAFPWEPQRRNLDRVGYGGGPNQTDCDVYSAYEDLLDGDGVEAMWWVDGGNANHLVLYVDDEAATSVSLREVVTIEERCPTVNWIEGGSFETEVITLDQAIGLRFTNREAGEIVWSAIATNGELLSIVQIPLWTLRDGSMVEFTEADLSSLAAEMNERLQTFGSAPDPPTTGTTPGTTTTTTTTTTPGTTTTTTPGTAPDTTVPVVEGLGVLLLDDRDLPEGWHVVFASPYSVGAPEDELVAVCPSAASMNDIDAALQWEAEYVSPAGMIVSEIIGRFADADAAAAAVRQFGEVTACDLSVIFGEASVDGGPIEVAGADAASILSVDLADDDIGGVDIVITAVNGNVAVLLSEPVTGSPEQFETFITIVELAVAKAAAADS